MAVKHKEHVSHKSQVYTVNCLLSHPSQSSPSGYGRSPAITKGRTHHKDQYPSAARPSLPTKTRRFPLPPHGRIGFIGIVNCSNLCLLLSELNGIASLSLEFPARKHSSNRGFSCLMSMELGSAKSKAPAITEAYLCHNL